ncbi:hypothetical protein Hanom_Chr04g00365401 [Helianthus anomalus]
MGKCLVARKAASRRLSSVFARRFPSWVVGLPGADGRVGEKVEFASSILELSGFYLTALSCLRATVHGLRP